MAEPVINEARADLAMGAMNNLGGLQLTKVEGTPENPEAHYRGGSFRSKEEAIAAVEGLASGIRKQGSNYGNEIDDGKAPGLASWFPAPYPGSKKPNMPVVKNDDGSWSVDFTASNLERLGQDVDKKTNQFDFSHRSMLAQDLETAQKLSEVTEGKVALQKRDDGNGLTRGEDGSYRITRGADSNNELHSPDSTLFSKESAEKKLERVKENLGKMGIEVKEGDFKIVEVTDRAGLEGTYRIHMSQDAVSRMEAQIDQEHQKHKNTIPLAAAPELPEPQPTLPPPSPAPPPSPPPPVPPIVATSSPSPSTEGPAPTPVSPPVPASDGPAAPSTGGTATSPLASPPAPGGPAAATAEEKEFQKGIEAYKSALKGFGLSEDKIKAFTDKVTDDAKAAVSGGSSWSIESKELKRHVADFGKFKESAEKLANFYEVEAADKSMFLANKFNEYKSSPKSWAEIAKDLDAKAEFATPDSPAREKYVAAYKEKMKAFHFSPSNEETSLKRLSLDFKMTKYSDDTLKLMTKDTENQTAAQKKGKDVYSEYTKVEQAFLEDHKKKNPKGTDDDHMKAWLAYSEKEHLTEKGAEDLKKRAEAIKKPDEVATAPAPTATEKNGGPMQQIIGFLTENLGGIGKFLAMILTALTGGGFGGQGQGHGAGAGAGQAARANTMAKQQHLVTAMQPGIDKLNHALTNTDEKSKGLEGAKILRGIVKSNAASLDADAKIKHEKAAKLLEHSDDAQVEKLLAKPLQVRDKDGHLQDATAKDGHVITIGEALASKNKVEKFAAEAQLVVNAAKEYDDKVGVANKAADGVKNKNVAGGIDPGAAGMSIMGAAIVGAVNKVQADAGRGHK